MAHSSETLVHSLHSSIPEDGNIHNCHYQNLKNQNYVQEVINRRVTPAYSREDVDIQKMPMLFHHDPVKSQEWCTHYRNVVEQTDIKRIQATDLRTDQQNNRPIFQGVGTAIGPGWKDIAVCSLLYISYWAQWNLSL
jgi:hypothetical protein